MNMTIESPYTIMQDNTIQLRILSQNIEVRLPLSDNNLDVIITIIQNMKTNGIQNKTPEPEQKNSIPTDTKNIMGGEEKNSLDEDVLVPKTEDDNKEPEPKKSARKEYHRQSLPDKEILEPKNESRNIPIYKPVVDYLIEQLKDKFTAGDIADLIYKYYNETLNIDIVRTSAQVYAVDYRKYLYGKGIIKIVGSNQYERKDKKKQD
jgi:hypothetical protein